MPKYCPSCGAPNDESSKFCASCGAPLESPAVTPTPSAAAPADTGGSRLKGSFASSVSSASTGSDSYNTSSAPYGTSASGNPANPYDTGGGYVPGSIPSGSSPYPGSVNPAGGSAGGYGYTGNPASGYSGEGASSGYPSGGYGYNPGPTSGYDAGSEYGPASGYGTTPSGPSSGYGGGYGTEPYEYEGYGKKKKSHKKLIISIVSVAVVLVLVVGGFFGYTFIFNDGVMPFFGSGPEKIAQKVGSAIINSDEEELVDLTSSLVKDFGEDLGLDQYTEASLKTNYKYDIEEIKDYFESELEGSYKWEVAETNFETEDLLDEFQDNAIFSDDLPQEYGIAYITITATSESDKDLQAEKDITAELVKYDGKWGLYRLDTDS